MNNPDILPDAIDTRIVYRVYARVAIAGGFFTIFWGPMWFGTDLPVGPPFAKAALVRIVGALVVAAGCLAAPMARVDDPETRRRGLLWFAAAHAVVLAIGAMQAHAIFDESVAEAPAALLLVGIFIFIYLWNTANGEPFFEYGRGATSLLGRPDDGAAEGLRSKYEEQIRHAAAQEERNRLARDLHDSIKQQIFAIHAAAATAQARIDVDRGGADAAIDQVRSSAREAMVEMDAMLDQLRAAPLENTGLVDALKKQCEALGYRTGAEVSFELGELPQNAAMVPGSQHAIFRVAQEALANVGRHARARRVRVRLAGEREAVRLTVEDDGAGFDKAGRAAGMGLSNMRARAAEAHGTLAVTSAPGAGTTVTLGIPLRASPAGDVVLYRRRAILWGAFLAVLVAVSAWRLSQANGADFPVLDLPVAAVAVIILVRTTLAWWRLRQARGARA